MPTNQFFKPEDVIFTYTSAQAVEDGILFDLSQVRGYEHCQINLITANLMEKGYWNNEGTIAKINSCNLRDLVIQLLHKIGKKQDTFYEVSVEAPSGSRIKVFVAQNESGRYTAMLPGDY
jgi:hypothetical protein